MRVAQIGIGLALALGIAACTRTAMPLSRDAAVETGPDLSAEEDSRPIAVFSDTAPIVADSAVEVVDASVVADSAVAIPDAAPFVADSAALVPDATAIGSDATGPDSADAARDSAPAGFDSGETAPDPYANRTFRIDPQHPAPTPDPSCTQYGGADYLQITFNGDLTTLNVLDVRGSAATQFQATVGPESSKLTYHVTGFLAGGVITFEIDHGVYVAEVILYGSGVPVVQCLRGALTPQP
jgi:hypothetical protein